MLRFFVRALLHIKKAFFYSTDGLNAAFKDEFAFRIEALCSIVALPAAFLIGHSALERIALISSFLLVPIIELINSAVETTLNRIDLEWHPLTKKAKDIGSAAVMLAIINGLFVWILLILPHH